jgi:septation ring formation regulator EzrA
MQDHSMTTPEATPGKQMKRKRSIDDKDHPKAKLIALLQQAISNTEEEIDLILDEIKDLEILEYSNDEENGHCRNALFDNEEDGVMLEYIEMYDDNDDMSAVTLSNFNSQSLFSCH